MKELEYYLSDKREDTKKLADKFFKEFSCLLRDRQSICSLIIMNHEPFILEDFADHIRENLNETNSKKEFIELNEGRDRSINEISKDIQTARLIDKKYFIVVTYPGILERKLSLSEEIYIFDLKWYSKANNVQL